MGYALAAEAARRGADVVLVTGPTALPAPPVRDVVRVRTAAEMHGAIVGRAGDCDAVIMAAAVANYTPGTFADQKIPHDGATLTLTLTRTPDILADLASARDRNRAEARPGPLLVGFAAETHDVVARARAKRLRKGIDLIVANDVSRRDAGFESEQNAVTLIGDGFEQAVPLMSKAAVANVILDRVTSLFEAHAVRPASRS
jgi:phosphopantothenoylcysteine decarboxylase/phosphopantothenate--cysteine ligase